VPYVDVKHTSGGVSPTFLEDCDIYVIAAPGRNFNSSEITAIENVVSTGGGLLLIGNPWSAPVTFDAFDVGFSRYTIGEPDHVHDFASFYVTNLREHPVTYVGSIRELEFHNGGWPRLARTGRDIGRRLAGGDWRSDSLSREDPWSFSHPCRTGMRKRQDGGDLG